MGQYFKNVKRTLTPKQRGYEEHLAPHSDAADATLSVQGELGLPAGMPLFLKYDSAHAQQHETRTGKQVDRGELESEADTIAERIMGLRLPTSVPSSLIDSPGPPTSTGGSLDSFTREKAESLLAYDFSDVRIHADADAARHAQAQGAHAFARGRDLYFGEGRYRPDLALGQGLIAHELTHVAQQKAVPRLAEKRATNPVLDHLHGLGSGRQWDSSLYRRSISTFRDHHPNAVLAHQQQVLIDPFSQGEVTPAPPSMRLQRCIEGCTPRRETAPAGPTGTSVRGAVSQLVATDDGVRSRIDRLRAALREIREGTSVAYNQAAGVEIINDLADNILHLPATDKTFRLGDWQWFVEKGPPRSATPTAGTPATPRAPTAEWNSRVTSFLQSFASQLRSLSQQFPRSEAANRLKNTPAQVFQLILDVANATIPPALLYAVASREGLVDTYIRPQIANPSAPDRLNNAELQSIRTDLPVSGFNVMGLDTFFTERTYTNHPLSSYFPSGFDVTQMTEVPATNEFGTPVRSAHAPNLLMALQALLAMLSRRQALFLEDAATLGYPEPTAVEKVYWTYVYYNTGPGSRTAGDGSSADNGGYQTLSRHRPAHPIAAQRRANLSGWLTRGEYSNAVIVTQSYQMIVAGGILRGY